MAVAPGPSEQRDPSTATAPAPRRGRGGVPSWLIRFLTLREGSIVVVTIIVIVYFAASSTNFLGGSNLKTLLPYFAPFAILAAGQVFIMTLGEIDLSVGSVYLFTPVVFYEFTQAGLPLIPALIIALLVALAIGAINGFATAWIGIPSFVATLGMLFVLSGLTLVVSHSEQVDTPGTSAVSENTFARIFGGGTYAELIWALVIVVILQVVLSRTRWGLHTVAVGGNRYGSAEAGIKTRFVLLRNFMLCALTAGFAGILVDVQTASISPDPTSANTVLLQSIAAVIIGGTLMTGGEGTVVGALIGAIFLGVLNEGLVYKSISSNYADLYLGLAILIAMTINVYVQRVRKGSGRA